MRAVACRRAELEVVDLPTPAPGPGQLLLEVLRCGICGSDLHARHHCDEVAGVMDEVGYRGFMRSEESVVMGHEFCGVIREHGPGCRKTSPEGTHVVAAPLVRRGGVVRAVGLDADAPGAYAEHVVVEESLAFPVPDGIGPELSVLTEPMAVGLHAVRRGEVRKRDVAIVIGCGPVGLAVICHLKAAGVRTVVASDFSAGRRALASRCGADVVVDPAEDSPYEARTHSSWITAAPAALDLAVTTAERLRRVPGWHHLWRTAERLGAGPRVPIVFECVGVPGVIDDIVTSAPMFSRVVVVGVCMGEDRLRPAMAINKEVDLRFALAYTPLEYRDSLHMLAEGDVDASALVTGTVGLEGVDAAFTALGEPDVHAKILIDPRSTATAPAAAA